MQKGFFFQSTLDVDKSLKQGGRLCRINSSPNTFSSPLDEDKTLCLHDACAAHALVEEREVYPVQLCVFNL